jgi:hypothetical protein
MINYFYKRDAANTLQHAVRNESIDGVGQDGEHEPVPLCVFKRLPRDKFEKVVQNQLSHIRKGCLQDPEDFHLYRQAQDGRLSHCCRGSTANERFNRTTNKVFEKTM